MKGGKIFSRPAGKEDAGWRKAVFFWLGLGMALLASAGWGQLTEENLPAGPVPPAASVPQASSPAERGETEWRAVLELIPARLPPEKKFSEVLGPLPKEGEARSAGSLTPAEFLKRYQSAKEETRLLMRRSARARFRELGRRGVVKAERVAELMGPEPAGVHGSRFFGMPPVPLESYRALLNYLQYVAVILPGSRYEPSPENQRKLDRALQASLALTSPAGRLQYADFDVVWSAVLRETACAGEKRRSLRPGIVWLYLQMREAAALDFLPPVPEDLARTARAEGGALFAQAREESRNLPPSLAALTVWRCGR